MIDKLWKALSRDRLRREAAARRKAIADAAKASIRETVETARARALLAYADAVKRGDTRAAHDRHVEAKRLTAEVLRMEGGR